MASNSKFRLIRNRNNNCVKCHSNNVKTRRKIALFVSGEGTNMKKIHKSCQEGLINADISVVVSDKPTCNAVKYAFEHNIPNLTYPNGDISKNELIEKLIGIGNRTKADYIILAGYIKLVPKEVVRIYEKRILNIHPSLLPKYGGKGFYGNNIHKQVIANGDRITGVTVHFVNDEYDKGHIVAQDEVIVYLTDTYKELGERIKLVEHDLYPKVIGALVDNRIKWNNSDNPYIVEHNNE
jgi:phosphoribosylglycinamide formyltransferase